MPDIDREVIRAAIRAKLGELGFCPHVPNCDGFNACTSKMLREVVPMDSPKFTRLSVLIPTRKRVERLKKLLSSYEKTTRDAEWATELVFRVDNDDLETRDFLTGQKMIVGERLEGYKSLPIFFNQLAASKLATGDVFMCGNDDMIFKSPHWGPALLDAANEFPDGIFDLGVTTHNETHYPFSVVSRIAVKRMGFIFDPRIFWGDIFLRDVMAAFHRVVMLPHIEIDHDWAGNDPDATFLEGNDYRMSEHNANHQRAVDEAVEKLKDVVRN